MIHGFSRLLARVGGGLIFVSAVLIGIDVASRAILNRSFANSFEFSTYAMAIAVAFGFAYALVTKAHIRIDILLKLLPLWLRTLFDIAALAVLTLFAGFLAWYSGETFRQSVELSARSNSTLALPLAIPQGIWLFGLVFFLGVCLVLLIRAIGNLLRGRFEAIQEEIGHGDDSQG